MKPPGVLLIIGSGHSGSTIIDMSLGRPAGLISLREYDRIADYLLRDPTCCCGQRFSVCRFWQPLLLDAPEAAARDGDPLALADAVANAMPDIRWLVDSSKNVDRARTLFERAPDRTKVLHLTRDGRGVVCSHLKQGFRNLADFAKDWASANASARALVNDLSPECARHLSYEELCHDPDGVVSGVLDWLSLGFSAAPPRINRQTHNIAGNRKRFTFHKRIVEDLDWHDRLGSTDLSTFERHAGALNRTFLNAPRVWGAGSTR